MPELVESEKLSLRGAKNSSTVQDVVDFRSPKASHNDEIDEFHEYRGLSGKVLYTVDEQIRVRALLSSPELIRQAYLDLLDSKSQEDIRFERLDYFEKAVAWAENPARKKIVDLLKQVLLSEHLFEIDDLRERKSIVGDKIEIYAMLKQFAPATLEEIAKLSKNARMDKVIAYAENIHNSQSEAINFQRR